MGADFRSIRGIFSKAASLGLTLGFRTEPARYDKTTAGAEAGAVSPYQTTPRVLAAGIPTTEEQALAMFAEFYTDHFRQLLPVYFREHRAKGEAIGDAYLSALVRISHPKFYDL